MNLRFKYRLAVVASRELAMEAVQEHLYYYCNDSRYDPANSNTERILKALFPATTTNDDIGFIRKPVEVDDLTKHIEEGSR